MLELAFEKKLLWFDQSNTIRVGVGDRVGVGPKQVWIHVLESCFGLISNILSAMSVSFFCLQCQRSKVRKCTDLSSWNFLGKNNNEEL